MPTREDVFPSKWLKAEDLSGRAYTLVVSDTALEPLQNASGEVQNKVVLYFAKTKKSLPLNRTNFDQMVEITRKADSDDWPGTSIEVYPTMTPLGNRSVPCIRIRAANGPKKPEQPPPPAPTPPLPPRTSTAPQRMKDWPFPDDGPPPTPPDDPGPSPHDYPELGAGDDDDDVFAK